MTNALLNQVNKSVEKGRVQDQTEEKSGFEREIIPENKLGYPARFVGYIEVGDRDGGEWQGKKKPNVRKAYLFFQLLSKKLRKEIEVDGETKVVYPVQRVMVDVKTGEKANLTKLFKRMSAGRDLTHIAQMLGEAFKVGIVHSHKKDDNGKVLATYENSRTKDDGWLVFPPMATRMDEETGEEEQVPMRVAEATEPMRLLLWDDPTPEQWDSIKGRPYEYGKGDTKKTFEGGFYQYLCVHEALDFAGSPLEAMLSGNELPDMSVTDPEDDDELPPPAQDDEDEDDPLGGLGAADMDDEIPF
jgi:hypothetical protein